MDVNILKKFVPEEYTLKYKRTLDKLFTFIIRTNILN